MTRQELQQALKGYRKYGYFLQVKLTATTSALQVEYNRIYALDNRPSSFESLDNPQTEGEPKFLANNTDGCPGNICPVGELPVLPEDWDLVQAWDNYEYRHDNQDLETTEEFMERKGFTDDYYNDVDPGLVDTFANIPFAWEEDNSDIEEFRELLDNSWLQFPESLSVFDLSSYANQTVRRIAQLSRAWCLREVRGFMSICHGVFIKLTTRTPRRVWRKASKFIADIRKASKGMLHAQYSK